MGHQSTQMTVMLVIADSLTRPQVLLLLLLIIYIAESFPLLASTLARAYIGSATAGFIRVGSRAKSRFRGEPPSPSPKADDILERYMTSYSEVLDLVSLDSLHRPPTPVHRRQLCSYESQSMT